MSWSNVSKYLLGAACIPLLFSTSIARAGDSPIKERVINGTNASEGEFPWMVALLYGDSGDASTDHFCGGTLVNEEWVMTARHCVEGVLPNEISVLVGALDLPHTRGDRIGVKGIVLAPIDTDSQLLPDLALVKLEHKVTGIPTLPLLPPSQWSKIESGDKLQVIGWGKKDPEWDVLPIRLQKATVNFFSDSQCEDQLGRYFRGEVELCAGIPESANNAGDGVDTCQGDSGGPIFLNKSGKRYLLGATSWGFGCATKYPGVYAEAQRSYDFLTSNPTIAPFFSSDPIVTGDAVVGGTVKCELASIGGDTADSIQYVWAREGETFQDEIAIGETYVVQEADLNQSLSCHVVASNAGGEATSFQSLAFGPIEAAVVVTPTPEPTPEATPTPQPTPEVILGAVSAKKYGQECAKGICEVVARVSNEGGYSATDVTGVFSEKLKAPCKNSPKMCSKTILQKISGIALGGEFWSFPVKQSAQRVRKLGMKVDISTDSGVAGSSTRAIKVQLPKYSKKKK